MAGDVGGGGMSERGVYLPAAEGAAFLKAATDAHVDEIAEVCERGEVAVVFHEIAPKYAADFRRYGYPERQVIPLPKRLRRALCNLPADPVTRHWLEHEREGVARVLLFIHEGSFLVNFHEERGWWIEPGSLDGAPT